MRRRFASLAVLTLSVVVLATACKKTVDPIVVLQGEEDRRTETAALLEKSVGKLKHKASDQRMRGVLELARVDDATSMIPKILEVLHDKTYSDGGLLGEANSAREAAILALQKVESTGRRRRSKRACRS